MFARKMFSGKSQRKYAHTHKHAYTHALTHGDTDAWHATAVAPLYTRRMRNMPSKRHQHVPLMTSFARLASAPNGCQVSKVDVFIVLLLHFKQIKMQMLFSSK